MNLLTLAIPTYNRHKLLLEQLKLLIPQVANLNIDCLIIDNCSEPPVKEYLKDKINLPLNVKVIRNLKNIGGDRNILKCYQMAETKWVWALADDDLIKDNAIEKIYTFIKANEYVLFISLSTAGIVTKGLKEFCEKIVYWASFAVSYNVINIELLKNFLPFYDKYVNTHQGILLTIMKYLETNKSGICVFKNLDVFKESALPQWSKSAFIYDTLKLFPILEKEFNREYAEIKKTLGAKIVNMLLGHLLNAYVYEGMSFKNYFMLLIKLLKYSTNTNIFGMRMLLIIITPLNKNIYRWARRKSGKKEYEFSNASKSLKWDY